jgi:hypothetical protein
VPSYVIFGLFMATLVVPTVVALYAAIFGEEYIRYFVVAIGIMLAVGLHAGIAYYSYNQYPEWWNNADWPLGFIYIPGLIGNVVCVAWSMTDLADKVDGGRRPSQRRVYSRH